MSNVDLFYHKLKPSELIRKYGWAQHTLGSSAYGYCLMGALLASGIPEGDNVATIKGLESRNLYWGRYAKARLLTGERDLAKWNDDTFRTAKEVIALLEEVEKDEAIS